MKEFVVGSVGRKSSVLKMKPSPAAPEIASMKCVRSASAPRTSALKRKVHMDDMMVLHGEYVFTMFHPFICTYLYTSFYILI